MKAITRADLLGLAADLLASGTAVWGPARRAAGDAAAEYVRLDEPAQLDLEAGLPRLPLKRLFLPPTEPLFWWRREGRDLQLIPAPAATAPVVVLGARPCDAAGVDAMDRVMGWDYRDEPWFRRREAATVVTAACEGGDEACFCGEVGLGPADPRGSDLLLLPAPGGYLVEAVTGKGTALIADHPRRFRDDPGAPASLPLPGARRAASMDLPAIERWLADHFDDESWNALAVRCHGCGACASVCPACHCFDIVDEPDSLVAGTRRRNWDSCQASRFTVHASGHNPRSGQHARLRQRVMHKFRVFPSRFHRVLCTGCGRCSRACPAGQDMFEILTCLAGRAAAETPDSGQPTAGSDGTVLR